MLGLILSGIVSVILALIIGIDDNPPGIVLCFAGMAAIVFAFVHHWNKSKNYVILLVSSIIGFVVFAVLHNVLEAVGMEIIGAVFFIIAILICPPALLIGLIGALVKSGRK